MGFWWSGLGLMGFVCRGSWVCLFCSPLYPPPPSLPLMVRLLSLKFRFFFFFLVCYGVDFWMDADCGGKGLAMGLTLLLNVDG